MYPPEFPSLYKIPENNHQMHQNNSFGVPQNQMQGGTQVAQQYTRGGTQTNTLGGSYGVAQTPDLTQYFNAMLKYKMAMEAKQRQAAMPQKQEAPPRQYQPDGLVTPMDSSYITPNDRLLQTMEQEAKMAQLQAMISPPPVKMQGQGPNQIPGYGMADPYMMSGAQRQAYLPSSSTIRPMDEAVQRGNS